MCCVLFSELRCVLGHIFLSRLCPFVFATFFVTVQYLIRCRHRVASLTCGNAIVCGFDFELDIAIVPLQFVRLQCSTMVGFALLSFVAVASAAN